MYSFTTCEPTLYDPEHPDAPPPPIKHKEVAKGIARATIKNKLTHESYRKMYNEGPLELLPNRAIRSKLHTIYTIEVENMDCIHMMTNAICWPSSRTALQTHLHMHTVII